MTYDIHESEEVVLHVLLAMKSNHRVVNSQQNFDVVVVLTGISRETAVDGLIDLLGYRVESPGYIKLWFCTGIKAEIIVNMEVQKQFNSIKLSLFI